MLGGGILAGRLLAMPGSRNPEMVDAGASLRVQGRLAELLLRQGGVSTRTDPIEIRVPELSAFLQRHVELARFGLRPIIVETQEASLAVSGRTSLRRLAEASGGAGTRLPSALLDTEVWVTVRGRVAVRNGEGELVVDGAAIGRQPVPPGWIWALLRVDPRDLLSWRMPRVVERIEVQKGRLLIFTQHHGGG